MIGGNSGAFFTGVCGEGCLGCVFAAFNDGNRFFGKDRNSAPLSVNLTLNNFGLLPLSNVAQSANLSGTFSGLRLDLSGV